MKRAADAEAAAKKAQDDLRSALAATNARLEAMDQQRVALVTEIDTLKNPRVDLIALADREQVKSRLDALEKKDAELDAKLQENADEMDTAGTALEERDKTIADLQARIAELAAGEAELKRVQGILVEDQGTLNKEVTEASEALEPLQGLYARVTSIEEDRPTTLQVQAALAEDFQKRMDTLSQMMQRMQEGWVKEIVAPAEQKLIAESASLAEQGKALTLEYASVKEQAAAASSAALAAETALQLYKESTNAELNRLREDFSIRIQRARIESRPEMLLVESPGSDNKGPLRAKRRIMLPPPEARDVVPVSFNANSMNEL